MFKRVSAFAVTVAMLLSMVWTFSFASAAESKLTLTVDAPETADRGDTVTVTVGLENYTPIAGLKLTGSYDSGVLALEELAFEDEDSEAYFPLETGLAVSDTKTDGQLKVEIADQDNVEVSGDVTLFVVTFKVADDAKFDEATKLSFTLTDVGAWDPNGDPGENFPDAEPGSGAAVDVEFDEAAVTAEITIACDHDDGAAWGAYTPNAGSDPHTHTRACSICGAKDTQPCDIKDKVVPPTHLEGGYTTHKCDVCGYVGENTDATDPEPHDWQYKKADTHDGTKANAQHVKSCSADDIAAETEACVWVDENGVETNPTCTEAGFITYTCKLCGEKATEPSGKEATGHKYVHDEKTEGKNATHICSNPGCNDTKACEFDNGVAYAATCTEAGGTTYTCGICEYSYKEADEEGKPATGHNYVHDENSDPSTHTCSKCSDKQSCNIKDEVVPPTHLAGGYTTHKCDVCGYVGENTDATEPLPHDWQYKKADTHDGTKANAQHVKSCSADDIAAETEACVWVDENGVETNPTCTEAGFITYTCKLCGEKATEPSGKEATGHNYVHDEKTEGKNATHTCSVCNDTKACEFDNGVAYDPTCTEPGGTIYTCGVCGYSYKEVDEEGKPATGHNYVHDENSDPSTHTCSKCSDKQDCDFEKLDSSEIGNCVTNGHDDFACKDCSYQYSKEIAAPGEHVGLVIRYYAATADAAGKWEVYCTACENVVGAEEVIEAGHPFPDVTNTAAWYYSYAAYGKAYGLFKGKQDGLLYGDEAISRAEFVTVLCRTSLIGLLTEEEILEEYANAIEDDFIDVAGKWYAPYARYMKTLGVVGGSYGQFLGDTPISRQEVVAMLHRLAAKVDPDDEMVFGDAVESFNDKDAVAPWAVADVEWARKTGLFTGSYGAFQPTKNNTRFEMAAALQRFTVAYYGIELMVAVAD